MMTEEQCYAMTKTSADKILVTNLAVEITNVEFVVGHKGLDKNGSERPVPMTYRQYSIRAMSLVFEDYAYLNWR